MPIRGCNEVLPGPKYFGIKKLTWPSPTFPVIYINLITNGAWLLKLKHFLVIFDRE